MTRRAAIYQRGPSLVLTASSRVTTKRWWKENGWTAVLGADALDEDLGAAVVDALAASTEVAEDLPVPSGPGYAARALGLASESAFVRGTAYVGLSEVDGQLTLSEHRRRSGGFIAEQGMAQERLPAGSDPATVGAAVRRVLAATG